MHDSKPNHTGSQAALANRRAIIAALLGASASVLPHASLAAPAADPPVADALTKNDGDAASDQPPQIDEVIVSARKIGENLQQVPSAITAIDSATIADRRIHGFQQLDGIAPNVYVQKQAGSPAAPQFNIRGVSTGKAILQADNGIGLYIDGVYLARPAASGFDMADIESIEIFRGPQGALFGRSAVGGAISITTAEPSGSFSLNGRYTSGNEQRREEEVTINLPKMADIAIRVTAAHRERDGSVDNRFAPVTYHFSTPYSGDMGSYTTSRTFGNDDTDNLYLAVTYDGIDHLKIHYKYDYTNFDGTMPGRQNLSTSPAFLLFSNYTQQSEYGGSATTSLQRLGAYPSNFDSPSSLKVHGQNLTLDYSVSPELTAKYIGGYRHYDQRVGANNLDGNAFVDTPPPPGCTAEIGCNLNGTLQPYVTLGALRNEWQHQVSHELQLAGSCQRFDGVVGLLYFDEVGAADNPVFFSKGLQTATTNALWITDYYSGAASKVDNESRSVYAHGTYRFGAAWELSAGLRYTQDRRQEIVRGNASVANYVLSDGASGYASGTSFDFKGQHTDYDASLVYAIRQDMNVYAKIASGYISGGVAAGDRFDAETITSYELGYKSEFLDRRVRFNVAVFNQDRNNLQLLGFSSNAGTFIYNGGSENAQGIEIEGTVVPLAGLGIDASYGYTDVGTKSGARTFQPKHTAALSTHYEFARWGSGALPEFRVDASYRSDAYGLTCVAGVAFDPETGCAVKASDTPNPALDRHLVLKGSVDLGARLSLGDIPLGQQALGRVSLWGQNLLGDKNYEYVFTALGEQATGTFQEPRSFGIDLSVSF